MCSDRIAAGDVAGRTRLRKATHRLNLIRSINIGRITGVDVNIHPTFAVVFLWAFLQWGIGPDGGIVPFLLGCVFVLLLVASVLLHELGHSFMSQQFGIRVLDITLWPFGGVARIEQTPAQPRAELLIALAGPAVNLAIVVAFLPILLLLIVLFGLDTVVPSGGSFGRMSVGSLVGWVVLTNFLLTLFNLLPAFPMDGGRVLRALLTPSLDRERATNVAVNVGMVLAVGMIAIGIWQRDIILPVIGIFVIVAAQAEGRVVRVESAMRKLRVGQFALWDMGGIAPDRSLNFALRGGPRDIVVTENGFVMGMLWRSQLMENLGAESGERMVADLMDSEIYVADVSESVYDVQQQMSSTNRWAVPVTEDGLYRGIFTADRFVHLYRQIAPGVFSQRVTIPEEWREAILEGLRIRPRRR